MKTYLPSVTLALLAGCFVVTLANQSTPLTILGKASFGHESFSHVRRRRNLNELGGGAHHHHGHHGDHGDHHGDHGDHGDHHGDHGDHHGAQGAATGNSELAVWNQISETDRFGCVAKFTCLLEAKYQSNSMTSQEAIVHQYITKRPSDTELSEMSVLKAPYYFAAFVGTRYGRNSCSRFFPDCRHGFDEMLRFVNRFNIVATSSA